MTVNPVVTAQTNRKLRHFSHEHHDTVLAFRTVAPRGTGFERDLVAAHICTSDGVSHRRRLGTAALALLVWFSALSATQLAQPSLAHAAPSGYYAKKCIIKAPSGPGVKGNGCNLYGAPYWVSGNKLPNGQPNKYMKACVGGASIAAVLALFSGPGAGPFLYAVMMGCASSLAEAKIFGS